MKIDCILDLMEEKDYIKKNLTGTNHMPIIHKIDVRRGTDFGKKLYEAIEKDNSYLIAKINSDETFFNICKKEDIDEWLKQFTDERTYVSWEGNSLKNDIFEYIKSKNYSIETNKFTNSIQIINETVRKQRKDEENRKNQEAIDLLEQLL